MDFIFPVIGLFEIIFSKQILKFFLRISFQKQASKSTIFLGQFLFILQGILLIYGGFSPLFNSWFIAHFSQ